MSKPAPKKHEASELKKSGAKESLSHGEATPPLATPAGVASDADTAAKDAPRRDNRIFELSDFINARSSTLSPHPVPFSVMLWNFLMNQTFQDMQHAGIGEIWGKLLQLPETGKAVASVRRAYSKSLRVPWPMESPLNSALEATVAAMKLDWLTLDGIGVSSLVNVSLHLVRHFHFSLFELRGLIAAKAAQNDTGFFARLADALKHRERESILSQALPRYWLPFGLWLMDDKNGSDILAKFLERENRKLAKPLSLSAYAKARERSGLYRHPERPIEYAEWKRVPGGLTLNFKFSPELARFLNG